MHFWSPVDVSLGRSALFGLELASTALLGVSRQGDLSYHIVYIPPSGTTGIYPLDLFCVTKCIPKTLDFRRKPGEYALFLRVLLSILMSDVFGRRLQSCRQIFFHCPFHKICWVFLFRLIHQSYRLSPLLLPGCSFNILLSGGHIQELSVLGYHRIRVNYPYPFLGVNFWEILHNFIRKITIKTSQIVTLFPSLW